MQVVQLRAFLEDRCFRGVQVFRFAVAQYATPKGNYAALVVVNGEDDPRPKTVIKAPGILARDQPGFRHQLERFAVSLGGL